MLAVWVMMQAAVQVVGSLAFSTHAFLSSLLLHLSGAICSIAVVEQNNLSWQRWGFDKQAMVAAAVASHELHVCCAWEEEGCGA